MVVDGTTITGTTPPTDESGYSSDSSVVVAAAPTSIPEGFQFIGWSLGGTTYYPNNSFDITDDLIGANNKITLTAVYQKIGSDDSSTAVTSITFNANGGTGTDYVVNKSESDPSRDLRVNEEITAPTVTTAGFTRTGGYKFLGWDPDKNATTPTYEAGRKIAADNKTGSGWDDTLKKNILYAIWQKKLCNIEVTKTVTGNMGDVNKSFTFTATLTDGSTFGDQGANSGITLSNDKKSATFSLKHGESVTITGVPSLASMKITESDANSYTTTVEASDVITDGSLSGKEYSFTVPEENGSVSFYNDKTVIVDTRLKLDFLPYVLILGAAIVGVAIILRRRKEV
jgi:hypothetical protein